MTEGAESWFSTEMWKASQPDTHTLHSCICVLSAAASYFPELDQAYVISHLCTKNTRENTSNKR